MLTTLNDLQSDNITPVIQNDEQATYAHKLNKQEAQLNWQQTAQQLHNQVRAFNPWPVAFFLIDDKTVRVWQSLVIDEHHDKKPGTVLHADKKGIDIACNNGVLRLLQLQPPGKKPMDAASFLNARSDWLPVNKQLVCPTE